MPGTEQVHGAQDACTSEHTMARISRERVRGWRHYAAQTRTPVRCAGATSGLSVVLQ